MRRRKRCASCASPRSSVCTKRSFRATGSRSSKNWHTRERYDAWTGEPPMPPVLIIELRPNTLSSRELACPEAMSVGPDPK